MGKIITVNASKTYDITIGTRLLDEAGAIIRIASGGQVAAIITDDNVAALYAGRLNNSLIKNGYRTVQYVFPYGEQSKKAEIFLSILDFLAESKLGRTDAVIALGGGVPGDLAGFAASCYMRGVTFIQIPTTLLAAVDSSVGGKTAINLAAGKNLAGAFYQPDVVICDVSLLSTLTPEVFSDGCAEVIKYGVISDKLPFKSLETPISEQLEDIIASCVEIKRDIVGADEFENGARKLLNFGHTVGHAIELLSVYSISHGNAIAAGMVIETRAAVRMGICSEACLQELIHTLRQYGLPESTAFEADDIARACLSDKKRDGGVITMVFPEKIGLCVLKEIPVSELYNIIRMGLGEI